jgi:hypothetical protein
MRLILALILVLVITMVAKGSEEQLKIVPASEVLHNIGLGNPLEYDNRIITGNLNLNKLEVRGDVHFNKTIFQDSVYFSSTKFSGIADFSSTTFNGDAVFSYSTFKKPASFDNSTFNDNADFYCSTFNDNANFCYSTFKGFAFFENSAFDGNAEFNYSTFEECVFFENATFKKKLGLTGTSYDKLSVGWDKIKDSLVYGDSAYLTLIKNFRDSGYFEDSDSCYFQYRKQRRDHHLTPIMKFIDCLEEWSCGYGTKPDKPFIGSLLLILLFGLAWRHLKEKDYESNRSKLLSILAELEPFGFSAVVFLSGARFSIDAPAIPYISERSKHLVKCIFILERILGAIFMSLLLYAVSRTIIRAA